MNYDVEIHMRLQGLFHMAFDGLAALLKFRCKNPFLLTGINFNRNMDHMLRKVWD